MSKKVSSVPQVRILKLLTLLLESRLPIPIQSFSDEEEWGDERTFRRLRTTLNQAWEEFRGIPLFVTVDAEGKEKTRGEDRYLKLYDKHLQTSRPERMAVMPALLQLLGIIKGTVISQSYTHMYKEYRADLDRKQRQYFDRTEKKFFYFGKGIKRYDDKADILDEVYDALLKERKLEVTRKKGDDIVTDIICPLTMILFNNGLYLACLFDDQPSLDKLYRFKIESFLSAKSLRNKPFPYPEAYQPDKIFEGSFGFINNKSDSKHDVVLEFSKKNWAEAYLKERQWTGQETYQDTDDGKCRMSFSTSDLNEVASWLLGMGPAIKVVGPKALQDLILERAQSIADIYR